MNEPIQNQLTKMELIAKKLNEISQPKKIEPPIDAIPECSPISIQSLPINVKKNKYLMLSSEPLIAGFICAVFVIIILILLQPPIILSSVSKNNPNKYKTSKWKILFSGILAFLCVFACPYVYKYLKKDKEEINE